MGGAEKGLKLRNYYYQSSWEEEYFVAAYGDTCTCLACGYVFGSNRKCNVEKHFLRYHAEHDITFPKESAARKREIAVLKRKLSLVTMKSTEEVRTGSGSSKKPSYETDASFTAPSETDRQTEVVNLKPRIVPAEFVKTGSGSTSMLSYKIAFILAKAMKPFEDGTIVKEAMIATARELMLDGEVRNSLIAKVNEVPLSDTTLARRVKSIAANISEQLTEDVRRCKWFSLQLGKSTDVIGTNHLSVFVRMVFDDCSVKEELLSIIPLKGRTVGKDIFAAFKENLAKNGVPLRKLVSITTAGHQAGLIGSCRQDPDFPAFAYFQCIIHQQSLCAKSVDVAHVLEPVTKIVNAVRVRTGSFPSLLRTADAEGDDGRLLNRFCEALPQVKELLRSRDLVYEQLEDTTWLLDLAFLADLTKSVNELNLKIQGKNVRIWSLVSAVNSFRETIGLWIDFFRSNEVYHEFEKLQKMVRELGVVDEFSGERFALHLERLEEAFNKRFHDFKGVEVVSKYLHLPMIGGHTAEISSSVASLFPEIKELTVRAELVKFRNDDSNRWKISCCEAAGIERFWSIVDEVKYENLVSAYKRLLSCFGSTYLCESIFLSMKNVKSRLRTRLTDDNLDSLLRISSSSYEPNFQKLGEETRSQTSH